MGRIFRLRDPTAARDPSYFMRKGDLGRGVRPDCYLRNLGSGAPLRPLPISSGISAFGGVSGDNQSPRRRYAFRRSMGIPKWITKTPTPSRRNDASRNDIIYRPYRLRRHPVEYFLYIHPSRSKSPLSSPYSVSIIDYTIFLSVTCLLASILLEKSITDITNGKAKDGHFDPKYYSSQYIPMR